MVSPEIDLFGPEITLRGTVVCAALSAAYTTEEKLMLNGLAFSF
jgi:hypothetical protein